MKTDRLGLTNPATSANPDCSKHGSSNGQIFPTLKNSGLTFFKILDELFCVTKSFKNVQEIKFNPKKIVIS